VVNNKRFINYFRIPWAVKKSNQPSKLESTLNGLKMFGATATYLFNIPTFARRVLDSGYDSESVVGKSVFHSGRAHAIGFLSGYAAALAEGLTISVLANMEDYRPFIFLCATNAISGIYEVSRHAVQKRQKNKQDMINKQYLSDIVDNQP